MQVTTEGHVTASRLGGSWSQFSEMISNDLADSNGLLHTELRVQRTD